VAQLKIGELQEQVKMLRLKNSELRAQARPGKRTGSRSILSGNEKLISQFAKKFTVMNEMFMPSGLPMQKPLTNSMHAGRYDSDLAASEGIIAEVYECLPESLHDDIANSIVFRNLVSNNLHNAFCHQSPQLLFSFASSSIQFEGASSTNFERVPHPKYLDIQFNTIGLTLEERPSWSLENC
jgi:hypothetical protein